MEVCGLAGWMQGGPVDIPGNMSLFHGEVMKVSQKSDVPNDIPRFYLVDRLFFQLPHQDMDQEQ